LDRSKKQVEQADWTLVKSILALVISAGVAFGAWHLAVGPTDANVLFIGNSYTSYNELADVVSDIAKANGTRLGVEVIAPGGFKLEDHAATRSTLDSLESGKYDFVVIQEQSMMPASKYFESSTIPNAKALAVTAQRAGSEVIFYQTWAHRSGNATIDHSYDSMRLALVDAYEALGRRNRARVAPAGAAMHIAFNTPSLNSVPLYDPDGSHPAPAGTYVAAYAIAGTIIGTELVEAPATIVSQEVANDLRTAANQALGY